MDKTTQVLGLLLWAVSTCIAVAPTLKLPLTRTSVDMAGHLGQPVINYYAPVNIGTPARRFNIQFDTNVNELFVPHYGCQISTSMHYNQGYLDKESSTSLKSDKRAVIQYLQCSLKGRAYQDVLGLDFVRPRSSHKVEQRFLAIGEVECAVADTFKYLEVDGFFGLSPAKHWTKEGSRVFLQSLHQARLIDHLQFAFWFNETHNASLSGELTFGGLDPDRYTGEIAWHPIDFWPQDTWAMKLQSVDWAGKVVSTNCSNNQSVCRAIVSTGVSDIYGPKTDVYMLYALLDAIPLDQKSLPIIDCSRAYLLPPLTFKIDGRHYNVSAAHYVRKFKSAGQGPHCYVAVLPSQEDSRTQWILGSNFLSGYYSVFDIDKQQVGFASLRRPAASTRPSARDRS